MLKRLALAFALTLAPMIALAGCVSFEQVAPTSPRAAIADAEVAIIGAANLTATLETAGVITRDEASDVLDQLFAFSKELDKARKLYKAGETLASAQTVAEFSATLNAIVLQLSVAGEAYVPVEPTPTPAYFRPSEA